MAYSTRAQVELAVGGATRLLQLSDFNADASEDADLVADAIAEADALIDSYVRRAGREVPLPDPVPPVIQRLSAQLAVYVLKQRRDAITELDAAQQEMRLEWLRALVAGQVDFGVNPPPPASAYNQPTATARASSKAISRANLKGFA